MTEKLYERDGHLTETDALVRACTPVDDGFDVLLDRSVLFPEGGGQPCDLGTIGEANLLFAREEGDEIVYRVDRPLPAGARVPVGLDWKRRFDFMQQHTGEHLLSFSFYERFAAANIGFHLALDYATIDLDKPLDHAQILEAERLANAYVWQDLPVRAVVYGTEEEAAAGQALRKHAEGLTAPIRVVSIEGADACTCCAPHCARTGEIGLILIVDAVSYKSGTRITFLCGERALCAARAAHDDLDTIARRFSCARADAVSAVGKLSDGYGALKRREKELVRALNAYLAAELMASAVKAGTQRLIVRLLSDVDADRLRELALTLASADMLVLLLSQNNGTLSYVLALGEGCPLPILELVEAVNVATGGRGGGRGNLAQGAARSGAGAQQCAEQLKDYLSRRLSASPVAERKGGKKT